MFSKMGFEKRLYIEKSFDTGGFRRVVLEHIFRLYDYAFVNDGKMTGTLANSMSVIGKVKDLPILYLKYR